MSITALPAPLIVDGKQLAVFGVATLKTAVDALLGKAAVQEPKITGDGVQAVEDAIVLHAPASVQDPLRFALGLVGTYATNAKTAFDVKAISALHLTSVSVDHAFDVLTGKLAPPT